MECKLIAQFVMSVLIDLSLSTIVIILNILDYCKIVACTSILNYTDIVKYSTRSTDLNYMHLKTSSILIGLI